MEKIFLIRKEFLLPPVLFAGLLQAAGQASALFLAMDFDAAQMATVHFHGFRVSEFEFYKKPSFSVSFGRRQFFSVFSTEARFAFAGLKVAGVLWDPLDVYSIDAEYLGSIRPYSLAVGFLAVFPLEENIFCRVQPKYVFESVGVEGYHGFCSDVTLLALEGAFRVVFSIENAGFMQTGLPPLSLSAGLILNHAFSFFKFKAGAEALYFVPDNEYAWRSSLEAAFIFRKILASTFMAGYDSFRGVVAGGLLIEPRLLKTKIGFAPRLGFALNFASLIGLSYIFSFDFTGGS